MDARLFDRKNYAPKTIETFEIMSAYYVDIFYNYLYTEAKTLKANGNVVSITEGYKHALNAFLKSLDNPKLYKKSITGIHTYFINIGFSSISFSTCIDRITKEFIPEDYFQSLTTTKKMGILRSVLDHSIKMFIRKIVDDHMSKIIDYHNDKDNARILQDDLIDCFILERESMFQRFITDKTKTTQHETVNRLVAERMQAEIKKLIGEKYELNKQIVIFKKYFLKKKVEEKKTHKIIKELQSQLNSLKQQNNVDNFFDDSKTSARTKWLENRASMTHSTSRPTQYSTPRHVQQLHPMQDIKKNMHEITQHNEQTIEVNSKQNNIPIEYPILSGVAEVETEQDEPEKDNAKDEHKEESNSKETMKKSNSSSDNTKNKHSITIDDADMMKSTDIYNDAETNEESSFIEVNVGNLSDIMQIDSEDLQKRKMDDFKGLEAFE